MCLRQLDYAAGCLSRVGRVLAETRARRVLRSLTLSKGLRQVQARRVLPVGKAGVLAASKEQLR